MAFVSTITCMACGKQSSVLSGVGEPVPTICQNCENAGKDAARIQHFHGLDGLSLERRIREIEKWIYDYEPPTDWSNVKF